MRQDLKAGGKYNLHDINVASRVRTAVRSYSQGDCSLEEVKQVIGFQGTFRGLRDLLRKHLGIALPGEKEVRANIENRRLKEQGE